MVVSQIAMGMRGSSELTQGASGSYAECTLDKSDLANNVLLSDPADLTFADNVHGLVSCDRVECTIDRSEPLASCDPLFGETMILLKDVVQVGRTSVLAPLTKFSRPFYFFDSERVCRMACVSPKPDLAWLLRPHEFNQLPKGRVLCAYRKFRFGPNGPLN